jgi:uncharacterized protein YndB with AHSA1/START domain
MNPSPTAEFDPALDLVLERDVGTPPGLVWQAWTVSEHVRQWFAPVPWSIPHCEIDLRPGGVFRCVMRSPEGKEYPNLACYLDVVPEERLLWTDALLPGFRPGPDPLFTAVLTLEARANGGTRYTVRAMHADRSRRQRHVEVGFVGAWGTALDQLASYLPTLAR